MPEAFVIEQQILPEITVNSGEGEDGEGTLASGSTKREPESKLGFRITGGVDFNMPITIFHVRKKHSINQIYNKVKRKYSWDENI